MKHSALSIVGLAVGSLKFNDVNVGSIFVVAVSGLVDWGQRLFVVVMDDVTMWWWKCHSIIVVVLGIRPIQLEGGILAETLEDVLLLL